MRLLGRVDLRLEGALSDLATAELRDSAREETDTSTYKRVKNHLTLLTFHFTKNVCSRLQGSSCAVLRRIYCLTALLITRVRIIQLVQNQIYLFPVLSHVQLQLFGREGGKGVVNISYLELCQVFSR